MQLVTVPKISFSRKQLRHLHTEVEKRIRGADGIAKLKRFENGTRILARVFVFLGTLGHRDRKQKSLKHFFM